MIAATLLSCSALQAGEHDTCRCHGEAFGVLCCKLVSMIHAGVTVKHFKEKLSRVLGLGNTTPDAATMTTAVRGLMFGDYLVPGQLSVIPICHPHP